MAVNPPLIDPDCLCARPHPCPLHGAWTGQRPPVVLNGFLLLRLIDDTPQPVHQQREAS